MTETTEVISIIITAGEVVFHCKQTTVLKTFHDCRIDKFQDGWKKEWECEKWT